MSPYFHQNESIYAKLGDQLEGILATISNRYIGSNPPHPVTFRAFSKKGFLRGSDYRYLMNLDERFPEASHGQWVYTWAKLWSEEPKEVALGLNCFGPVQIYLRNELVFKSSIVEETNPKRRCNLRVRLEKGWNHFILQFMKTPSGFGGIFGTGSFKRFPLHFLMPSEERNGQEGWLYTQPLDGQLDQLPQEGMYESETDVKWLPDRTWGQERPQLSRMFGCMENRQALAWTKLVNNKPAIRTFTLRGENKGPLQLFINGECVYHSSQDKEFQVSVDLPFGEFQVVIKSTCQGKEWGFQLDGGEFALPVPIDGAKDVWMYAGPFSLSAPLVLEEVLRMDTLLEGSNGPTYWRLDMPDTWVRPYLENPLFGKWDYPLGVTLFGLLQTGQELNREDIVNYALLHIETCTSFYQYSLWDRKEYGAAGINTQLSAIDSLDDCGSFGATMLVGHQIAPIRDAREVADDIADYISNKQSRLPNQALYRSFGSVEFMKNTVWCDDLYMSVPFLCRYFELTKDSAYLDDAVNQFLRYKELLFIPGMNIMSHVYDFKFNTTTGIPWGRGNGWVIFSLSELLAVLPESHPQRIELLTFFRELAEGYLALQGENGLWHQVLTEQDSYEETSCTAMFIYAFARGIRYGWLEDPEEFIEAVFQGFEGLSKVGVDKYGNVYGVCQGSGYAFTKEYYKDDLTWILNDTHGIGIVLLSGIETLRLKKWMAQQIKGGVLHG
ncbi:glycoside hydrolase family 88/105 protein [Neobacillus dielmonensis]|uniref:glycoside hydrolase family 88/105 protein n=1 Tax=Neobacillus dielmonensis TaxID=1347369 RepID=UPI0005A66AB9|nr:glycoside hydrolase family 88 protein [Neobacillus dielmonensis]